MKLLQELYDLDHYGAWVDARTRKVYPVYFQGHKDKLFEWCMDIIQGVKPEVEFNISDELLERLTVANPDDVVFYDITYKLGFDNHLVRIYNSKDELDIDGNRKDVVKIFDMFVGDIKKYDIYVITIDTYTKGTNRKSFSWHQNDGTFGDYVRKLKEFLEIED